MTKATDSKAVATSALDIMSVGVDGQTNKAVASDKSGDGSERSDDAGRTRSKKLKAGNRKKSVDEV